MNQDDLRELYQEVIITHNKHPYNKGIITPCTCQSQGHNPTCGDQVTIYLNINCNNDIINNISFEGEGCAISIASASIMTKLLKNKPLSTAKEISQTFQSICTNTLTDNSLPNPEFEDLNLLTSVKHFPARVKCATLAWHTLDDAIKTHQNT